MNILPAIEKLKGSENYNDWSFAMKSYLEHDNLWQYVESPTASLSEQQVVKAAAKLKMSVDKTVYSHIRESNTPKQIWDALKTAFADSGLTSKVYLLKKLITTRLGACKSVDEYVDTIFTTAHKLNNLKFNIIQDWLGVLLLAGLPDHYRPMVMALENSGTPITGDAIKVKLLQEINLDSNKTSNFDTALYSKRKPNNFNQKRNMKDVICYKCNLKGHVASKCRTPPNKYRNNSQQHNSKSNANYVADTSDNEVLFMALSDAKELNINDWYVDSGATEHMSSNKKLFTEFKEVQGQKVTIANNETLDVKGQGIIKVTSTVNEKEIVIRLQNCLYIPDLKVNLISVNRLTQSKFKVLFDDLKCKIVDSNNRTVAIANKIDKAYKLQWKSVLEKALYSNDNNKISSKLWHQRLAHLNRKSMLQLNDMSLNYEVTNCTNEPCEICVDAKMTKLPFEHSRSKSNAVLDLIHTDLC